MRSFIRQIDARVDAVFDELRADDMANRVFYTASALGDFGLMWVILALVRALRGRPGDDRAAVRAIVATGIESVVVNAGMKSIFQRGRPVSEIVHPYPFRQPLTSSFPSGHATAAFCAAVLLSEGDELAPLYYAGATIVALSRIHTKIHHASDVVGGIVIGLALGVLGRRLSPLRTLPTPKGH
jgi:undecaprenyl-diphosphatase